MRRPPKKTLFLAAAAAVSAVAFVISLIGPTELRLPSPTQPRSLAEQSRRLIQHNLASLPENPSIEEAKQYLLFCAAVYHPEVIEDGNHTRFLDRWQAAILEYGPETAKQRALQCYLNPAEAAPDPPIIPPLLEIPSPAGS